MLCCRQWQFSVLSVSRSMGEGRLTSSRIVLTIDDYQILQTSAWAHFGVISEQAPVFCQIFFWPVMHIFSSPLFFHVLLEQYSPHLCVKQPIFSVILGKSCGFFPSYSHFSDPFLFPSSIVFWEWSAAFHCSISSIFMSELLAVVFAVWQILGFVTYTSVQLIRNISDCMILSLSTSINWSNLLRLSYVCVMACDKQINHIADRFHLHSQVIPSSCANHVKKYIYICQQLGVFSIFPSLRIHSVCDKCVLMIGKWGLLNFCNCKPSVMVAYHMGRSEGLAWQQTSSGKRWFSKS